MRRETGIRLGPGREFDLIRTLVGEPGKLPEWVQVGPGDDCAVFSEGLVVSVDLSVEDVHFRRDWVSLEEAGYRAASSALSDLAAMAAAPLGVLLSLALHPDQADEEAPALQAGVVEACRNAGTVVLGGDLSRSPGPAVLDVVVLGRGDPPILRSGARPGDEVWVTGWLGGSAAAVQAWEAGEFPPPALREAFVRPSPRIREARWLHSRARLHAAIDLSDGLAGDAGHLAVASGVGLTLRVDSLPLSPGLEGWRGTREERLHFALRGGEDYELCLTAPPGALDPLVELFHREFGIPLTRVGEVREGRGVHIEGDPGGRGPAEGGFSHFHRRETG